MRLQAVKWFATALLSTASIAFVSTSTEVEACCGRWSSFYGRCGGCGPRCCYGPVTGSCCPTGCGTTYYGPVVWGGCSPCGAACAPCGSGCAPCATSGCAPCTGGDCALGAPATGSTIAPQPNEKWERGGDGKKTFAPPEPGETNLGAPADQGAGKPLQLQDEGTEDVFEKPTGDSQEKASGAAKSATSGSKSNATGPGASKGTKKGPPAPRIKDDSDGSDSSRIPTIRVDEKVAWRAAPVRQRIEVRAQPSGARLVRLPTYPRSEWVPVDGGSKIASK